MTRRIFQVGEAGPWLVSACLVGVNARRHQRNCFDQRVLDFVLAVGGVPCSPEQMGGMGRPFPACEIVGEGGGEGVLSYKARVKDKEGNDYTDMFIYGSEEVYRLYCTMKCVGAIMHTKSISCGVKGSLGTHAGKFDMTLVDEDGVTSAYLRRKGVPLYTELTLTSIPGYAEIMGIER